MPGVERPSPGASARQASNLTWAGRSRRLVEGRFRNATRRAREARLAYAVLNQVSWLPLAVGRARTLARVAAGARDRAGGRGLRDREGAARRRRGHDRVALGAVRGDRHVVQVARRDLLVGDQSGVVAGRVGLRVGVTGLDVRDRVARGGLGTGVLRLGPLAEERRQGDRGQDADDQHDDEELDQGETLLVLDALAELVQHVNPPGSVWA